MISSISSIKYFWIEIFNWSRYWPFVINVNFINHITNAVFACSDGNIGFWCRPVVFLIYGNWRGTELNNANLVASHIWRILSLDMCSTIHDQPLLLPFQRSLLFGISYVSSSHAFDVPLFVFRWLRRTELLAVKWIHGQREQNPVDYHRSPKWLSTGFLAIWLVDCYGSKFASEFMHVFIRHSANRGSLKCVQLYSVYILFTPIIIHRFVLCCFTHGPFLLI